MSDASDFATGAVLSMLCEDEKWHPCAFLSKGLNDVERNYDVHDKEMLGIIQALETWRHYLEGGKHKIDIWTDHQNLKYFMTSPELQLQNIFINGVGPTVFFNRKSRCAEFACKTTIQLSPSLLYTQTSVENCATNNLY